MQREETRKQPALPCRRRYCCVLLATAGYCWQYLHRRRLEALLAQPRRLRGRPLRAVQLPPPPLLLLLLLRLRELALNLRKIVDRVVDKNRIYSGG